MEKITGEPGIGSRVRAVWSQTHIFERRENGKWFGGADPKYHTERDWATMNRNYPSGFYLMVPEQVEPKVHKMEPIGAYGPECGRVRSVVFTDTTFSIVGDTKKWKSDRSGAEFENFGSLMLNYPSGLEEIPEKTEYEKAIAFFEEETRDTAYVMEYSFTAKRHAAVIVEKALADASR